MFCSLPFLENVLSFTVRELPSYIIYGSTSEIFVDDGCSFQSSHTSVNFSFVYSQNLLKFCGLMDISATALSITGYYECIEPVNIALKAVSEIVFKEAAKEEQEKNKERGLPEDRLTVSGDGS